METLLDQIFRYMPEGPKYYPADQVTDHPEQFMCAELIREKILHMTHEEVPHSIAVETEEMRRKGEWGGLHRGRHLVERDSQKGIIIGNTALC